MNADQVEHLLGQYREAMLAGRFEALFPLFAEDVVWQEGGDNPLSGVYQGRGGLIDLFSRVMDYSRNTFTVASVGPPAPAGRGFALPLAFQVRDGAALGHGAATHTLRLRNNSIARITSQAAEPAAVDALWRRLAVASGLEPEGDAMDPDTLAIPADALQDAFEAAVIELRALPQPPP